MSKDCSRLPKCFITSYLKFYGPHRACMKNACLRFQLAGHQNCSCSLNFLPNYSFISLYQVSAYLCISYFLLHCCCLPDKDEKKLFTGQSRSTLFLMLCMQQMCSQWLCRCTRWHNFFFFFFSFFKAVRWLICFSHTFIIKVKKRAHCIVTNVSFEPLKNPITPKWHFHICHNVLWWRYSP